MHRLRHARLLLLTLLATLVLAACSGGEDEPTGEESTAPAPTATSTPTATETSTESAAAGEGNVLTAAVESSASQSQRFELTTTAQTPQGEIVTSGEGVATADGSSRVTLTIEGAGAQVPGQEGPIELETILLDDVIYQRFPQLAQQFGSDAEWFRIDASEVVPGFEQLVEQAEQSDPTQSFAVLREVADVEEVGTEEVNGVSTTHYRGQARLGDLLEASGVPMDDLGAAGSSIDEDQLIPIDAYLDDDGRLRRLVQEIEVEGVTTSTTVDILEYGVEADIQPPPEENTADLAELLEQAQQGAGGAGGNG